MRERKRQRDGSQVACSATEGNKLVIAASVRTRDTGVRLGDQRSVEIPEIAKPDRPERFVGVRQESLNIAW